jgi:uncharacterized protein (TIGR02145 family)
MKTNLFRNIKLPLLGRGLGGGLLLLCVPVLLFAQGNGVKVSNLAVSTGSPTTVTFNVSWNKTGMPDVWSDTVWVFVDYNNNGVMERLPVTSATLTATSAPGVGKVVEDAGNNQGMWVVGNARTQGSFSATVKLLTTVKDVAGACAYASNYPPVGKYSSDAPILSFTGTPPYELLLAKAGSPGETEQVESGNKFLLPCDYTLTSFTDATGAPGIMGKSSTAPSVTVDFTAFDPDPSAATGTVWYLTDTRESNNIQTYKVKKMQDGRIWMVQDLKFGDRCNKDAFAGSSSNQTNSKLTSISGYIYGDCMNKWNASSTPNARGYLYDWAATIQKADAYYGSGSNVGCSGTVTGIVSPAPGACQGICPKGWHVPTGNTTGEFYALHNVSGRGCSTGSDKCWNASSDWEGVLGGYCGSGGGLTSQGSSAHYWTSTHADKNFAYRLNFSNTGVYPGTNNSSNYKNLGFTVRCVRNY